MRFMYVIWNHFYFQSCKNILFKCCGVKLKKSTSLKVVACFKHLSIFGSFSKFIPTLVDVQAFCLLSFQFWFQTPYKSFGVQVHFAFLFLHFVVSFICVVLFGSSCYGLKSFCWFIKCLCALQFLNFVIILFLYLVTLIFASCFFNFFFGCLIVLKLHRHIFCGRIGFCALTIAYMWWLFLCF